MSRAQSKDQVYGMYAYQHPPTRIDCFGNSVTRFGKISPLGQIKKTCLAIFERSFSVFGEISIYFGHL